MTVEFGKNDEHRELARELVEKAIRVATEQCSNFSLDHVSDGLNTNAFISSIESPTTCVHSTEHYPTVSVWPCWDTVPDSRPNKDDESEDREEQTGLTLDLDNFCNGK